MNTDSDNKQEEEYVQLLEQQKDDYNESCQNHLSVVVLETKLQAEWELTTLDLF